MTTHVRDYHLHVSRRHAHAGRSFAGCTNCLIENASFASKMELQEATKLSGGAATYNLDVMPLTMAIKATEKHADLAFRFVPAMKVRRRVLGLMSCRWHRF